MLDLVDLFELGIESLEPKQETEHTLEQIERMLEQE